MSAKFKWISWLLPRGSNPGSVGHCGAIQQLVVHRLVIAADLLSIYVVLCHSRSFAITPKRTERIIMAVAQTVSCSMQRGSDLWGRELATASVICQPRDSALLGSSQAQILKLSKKRTTWAEAQYANQPAWILTQSQARAACPLDCWQGTATIHVVSRK